MITCPSCSHTFEPSLPARQARALAKRTARLAYQSEHGKRCSTCLAMLPVAAYGISRARPDGLQPVCRACLKARSTIIALSGGKALWGIARDAMRAVNRHNQALLPVKLLT